MYIIVSQKYEIVIIYASFFLDFFNNTIITYLIFRNSSKD